MTMIEYLLYLKYMKGYLFDGEARFDEILPEDKETLIRQGLIFVEELSDKVVNVELTKAGEEFLNSIN